MKKTLTVISISFIIGVAIQIYIGHYKDAYDLANMIAVVLGGAIGFLIAVLIIPAVVALVIFLSKRVFPYDTFVTISYVILAILTIIMFIGQSQLKGMSLEQKDEIEEFREQAVQDCITITASVNETIKIANKADMQVRASNYCKCLYQEVKREDIKRVIDKKVRIPELLNIEYKKQQEECFKVCYNGVNTIKLTDLMETDSEKQSFWSSRLVSYYLMTYGEFKSTYLLRTNDCFEPKLRLYSKRIADLKELQIGNHVIYRQLKYSWSFRISRRKLRNVIS